MDNEKIILAGKEYDFTLQEIELNKLKFYVDNPRVYSKFDRSAGEPTQEEIEEILSKTEKVKELRLAIKVTGLLTPLVVRNGDLSVLEGNQRLAALRMLAKEDLVRWKTVKCNVLPSDVSDEAVFILLGQYHMNGQTPWVPFELAGYLYRRIEETGKNINSIAKELAKQPSEIKTLYETYKFMVNNSDLEPSHWSYYVEYLKNRGVKKLRESNPELDKKVITDIQNEVIINACKDVRETLGNIAKMPKSSRDSIIKEYISGEITWDDCSWKSQAINRDYGKDIRNFRMIIHDDNLLKIIDKLNESEKQQFKYDLERIKERVGRLLKKIDKESTMDSSTGDHTT